MKFLVFSVPGLMTNEGVLGKPLSSATFLSTQGGGLISIQQPHPGGKVLFCLNEIFADCYFYFENPEFWLFVSHNK